MPHRRPQPAAGLLVTAVTMVETLLEQDLTSSDKIASLGRRATDPVLSSSAKPYDETSHETYSEIPEIS